MLDNAERRAFPQLLEERAESPLGDLGVGIEEEHERCVGGQHAAVVAGREAVILGANDARLWELSLDELRRPVARVVIDDDDVELRVTGVGVHGREARDEPIPAVVRHDDDGEIWHGASLTTRRNGRGPGRLDLGGRTYTYD